MSLVLIMGAMSGTPPLNGLFVVGTLTRMLFVALPSLRLTLMKCLSSSPLPRKICSNVS